MSFGRSDMIGHEIRKGNHTTKLSCGGIRIYCPKPSECPKVWPSAVVYLGADIERFERVFAHLGTVRMAATMRGSLRRCRHDGR